MANWGTGQLKDFLTVRGMTVSGTRPEILARVFVAWEQKVKIRMNEQELLSRLKLEYESRLEAHKLTDPRK